MRAIAFESKRLFSSLSGFGTYCRTLINDLSNYYEKNRYILFAHESSKTLGVQPTFCSPEIQRIVNLSAVDVVFPPDRARLLWKLLGANREIRSHQVSLYHGLANQIPRSIRRAKIPKIVTVHDLIYRQFPELFPGEDLDTYDRQLRKACAASDRIIAVSESTKRDLEKFFSISPERINVIYSACDRRYRLRNSEDKESQIRLKYHLPDRYLLYVGSMTVRKNLLSIIQAMNLLPPADMIPLVIVGTRTSYTDVIQDYAEQHGLKKWLVFPKGISTEDLPTVYRGASIFLYTSLYEGFGMPILEALACGVPVITSNNSAMPEAAGFDSRLVDPKRPEEIALGIVDILSNTTVRQDMIEKGYLHSTKFENRVVTNNMVELYKRVLSENDRKK